MKSTKQLPGSLPPGCDLDSPLTKEQAAIWLQVTDAKLVGLVHARLIPAITFDRQNWRFHPRTCLEFWKKGIR